MATLEQIVAQEVIEYYDCVHLDIGPGEQYYFTHAPYNITLSDTNTYQAAGGLLQMSDFVDNANFSIESLSVGLAGIVEMKNGASVMEHIQTLDYLDRPVIIRRAFMEDHAVAHDIVLYKGYITGMDASFNTEGDTTQVQVSTSSHWTDFDRVSTRYTNTKSQQEFYPTDDGFEYAVDVQKEVIWREAG